MGPGHVPAMVFVSSCIGCDDDSVTFSLPLPCPAYLAATMAATVNQHLTLAAIASSVSMV